MPSRLKHIICVLTIGGVLYLATGTPALAQSGSTTPTGLQLTVSPGTVYFRLKPGSSKVHTITLINKSTQSLRVTPTLMSFSADGTTGQPRIGQPSDFPYIANKDAAFVPLVLPGGKSAQLELVLTIPKDAQRTEYPLTVLFQSEPLDRPSAQAVVNGYIGSNLIVSIGDESDFFLRATDIRMPNLVDSFRGVRIAPLIENTGPNAQQIIGDTTIVDWRGNQVAAFTLRDDMVLGKNSRVARQATLENDGESLALTYQPRFLLGPYKVTTTIHGPTSANQNSSPPTSSYSEVFFAFPLLLTGLVLAASVALVGLRYYLRSVKKEYI